MKLFLDTANIDDIKKYASWGLVDGVTTNPSLIAKEGVKFENRIKEITDVIDGAVSAEVISSNAEEMIKEGKELAKIAKNIYIKVPCTPDGLIACQAFKDAGIRTNVTLVFSANQALLAAKAGAAFVSPFIGRLNDIGEDGMQLIAEIVTIYENYSFETEILVASIRETDQIKESAMIGADICTIPPKIYEELIKHDLTDKGIEKFMTDWEKTK